MQKVHQETIDELNKRHEREAKEAYKHCIATGHHTNTLYDTVRYFIFKTKQASSKTKEHTFSLNNQSYPVNIGDIIVQSILDKTMISLKELTPFEAARKYEGGYPHCIYNCMKNKRKGYPKCMNSKPKIEPEDVLEYVLRIAN